MADREARPSTDEETAPLLQPASHPDDNPSQPSQPSLTERISAAVQEPLTPLSKFLIVLVLLFLLLSSIFIGLFAGAQHKLNNIGDDGKVTSTVTVTQTATKTSISTETDVSTTIATATSTSIATTTVAVPIPGPTHAPEEKACFSPDCIVLASSIISSLDPSQDPCENFYDFATGGWRKSHPIPSDKGSIGSLEEIAVRNRRLLQQILSQDSSSIYTSAGDQDPYDEQLLKKLRVMYNSCMDEELLDARGADPLLRVVKTTRQLFKGETTEVYLDGEHDTHLSDDEKRIKRGLTAAVAYLHSRGVGALFSIDIEGDVGEDPNHMTLLFGQPQLGLPSKEYYEEESIVTLYRNVLERLLINLYDEEKLLAEQDDSLTSPGLAFHEERLRMWPPWPWPPWGGDDDGGDDDHDHDNPVNRTEEAHKLAKKIVKLERKIANASLDLDILLQDPVATYNPVPISNLTSDLPQFDFPLYFSTFAPRTFPTKVILDSLTFPSSLSRILKETDPSTIQAYLETRAALALAGNLGTKTEAWKAVRSLEERLRGIKPGAVGDRAEFCVSKVEATLGFAAGRYFVQQAFGGDSKTKGTKVITDIINAFKRSLQRIKWMDDESAKAAAEKADAIRVKVGYPLSPDTRSARSLAFYYARVKVHETTFFENVLSARQSDVFKEWLTLGRQRDPEAWEMYPSMVNAYFEPPANEIVFPAGILQPPVFAGNWPGYLAYGAFGQVAAHELTHAFDSAGRLYNQQGKLEQWWSNATSERYQVIQDCIVKQYSSYYVEDSQGNKVYVNGNLTSGENIGDSGLIQAYRAWQSQFDDSFKAGTEYLLPGLNYTREQLFFIAFGVQWAQNIKPESAVARVRSDPHSPNRFRVDGTVRNIPEFAKAFNCSAKAKLNPPQEERCLFW
ncbi:metalloprotease [Panus rudis PR-1116 ss-1]|nr:metalloprotease [Panus rudis PR-1116 ss-1]